MPIEPDWWKKRPGEWESSLEDALASDSTEAIGLAWAIIMTTGGEGRGCKAEFSRLTGVSEGAISSGLAGKSFGPKQQARVIAATNVRDELFDSGRHPFSVEVNYLDRVIEPGDRLWTGIWEIVAADDPNRRTASELRQQYPKLFPS